MGSDCLSLAGSVRAFVALPIPEDLAAAVVQIQDRLRSRVPPRSVRWCSREQLHLTLRFLGDVPASSLEALRAALGEGCCGAPPLALALAGAGGFPDPRAPRVIWVGVAGEVERLCQFQARLETRLAGFGEPADARGYHPHLTIGRIKGQGREARAVGAALQGLQAGELGSWVARRVRLVQSHLSSAGARYTDLATFDLEGPK
jgi:2'-5' RNA ligase